MADFDSMTNEFLSALRKDSTRQTYEAALELFQKFYTPQGTIQDFLVRVENDYRKSSFLYQERVAIHAMNDFVRWMKKETRLKGKTMRTYAGALQSLVRYFLPCDVKISTTYAGLPSLNDALKKFHWDSKRVSEFVYLMGQPIYACLVGVFFQSGISVSHAKELTFGDIREEYDTCTVPLCLDFSRINQERPYLTFMGKAGVKLLRTYLEYRERRESIESHTTLFPISASAIERYFNRRARKLAEYNNSTLYSPGSLAAAFRTHMRITGCPTEVINFWSGHNSALYSFKSKEGWRAEYAKFARKLDFKILARKGR